MTTLFVWDAKKRNLTIKFQLQHTHTHTHTPIHAQSYSSLTVKLGWWGAAYLLWLTPCWQAHYSGVSGDLGVTEPKSLRPAPSSFLPHSWHCLTNIDTSTTLFIQTMDPPGSRACSEPGNTFQNDWNAPECLTKKLILCPPTVFPPG